MGNMSHKISNVPIKEKPYLYDANDKFIAYIINEKLYLFSFEKSLIIFSTDFTDIIINDLKFHPNYYNILAITCTSSVLLYNIEGQNLEKKVEFRDSSNKMLKTEFNPNKINILATLSKNNIKIWNKNSYYYLHNINIIGEFEKKMRWSNRGNYIIYKKNNSKVEIFSYDKRNIISYLDKKLNDFYLLEGSGTLLCLTIENLKNIILFDLIKNIEIFKINLLYRRPFNSILDIKQSLLYLYDQYKLVIYDIKEVNEIYSLDLEECMEFRILKDIYNKVNLFSKFIVYSDNLGEKSGFKLYEFYSKKYAAYKVSFISK